MLDLLLNFLEHIEQTVEVLLGAFDSVGGLAAAFLILRNARSLLDEDSHVLRFRLDQARNHALLDNRVTARTETGAEEHTGYVLAATLGAVQEIGRNAVATDLAADRDFGVLGVLPFQGRFGVVEQKFDRRSAYGLARA